MGVIRVRNKKIKRLYFKELTQAERDEVFHIKKGPNTGKSIPMFKDKTHKVKLQLEDDTWFEAGVIKATEGYPVQWRKEINGEWVSINEGAEVDFNAQENGPFNAKIIGSTVDVITNGPDSPNPFIYGDKGGQKDGGRGGGASNTQSTTNTYTKDTTGIETGHSINCALEILKHKFDPTKILELSKNAHDITDELKIAYKPKFSSMSEYDFNAMIGHAVLNAFKIGGKRDVLLQNAKNILDNIVPAVMKYIKDKKAAPVPEPEEDSEPVGEDVLGEDDDSDSIPF